MMLLGMELNTDCEEKKPIKKKKVSRCVLPVIAVILAVSLLFSLCSCSVETTRYLIGTVVNLKIEGNNSKKAEKAILSLINDVERSVSTAIDNSCISRINRAEVGGKVALDDIADMLIGYAYTYYFKLKDLFGYGVFDISVYPLVELWGFSPDKIDSENKTPPSNGDIDETMELVGLDRAFLYDGKEKTITKLIDGAKIDLGGLAKGYIADEAHKIFEKYGVKSGIADIGGNLYLYGDRTLRVGVKNPRKGATDDYIKEIITVKNTSVVTSGDYERYYIDKDGRRYHHIIDPRNGRPSDSGLISVTVTAKSSVVADILTTSIMILGKERGELLLQSEDIETAIFMSEDGEAGVKVETYTKGEQDRIAV